jgi:hypothetical protein
MEIKQEVRLTPDQVAEAIWEMDTSEQADMLNKLIELSDGSHKLMMQFLGVRQESETRDDRSLEAFQIMFSSAYKYMST